MRMWMIPPELMCNKHLLGEHSEIHKHRHVFVKGHSIKKRVSPIVQICPVLMGERHDEIVLEMIKRGMNHLSPYSMPDLSKYSDEEIYSKPDLLYNIDDLKSRCSMCCEKMMRCGI